VTEKTFEPPSWVAARDYQQDAIKAWSKNSGRGILRMATGTGKTVTALLSVAQTAESIGDVVVVITVPYQHLVDQWAEDIEEFGVEPVRVYRSRRRWQEPLQRQLTEFRSGARSIVVAVVTHTTFASEPFQRTLSRTDSRTMLVADEVHHLGAPHLRKAFPEEIPLRLGLSATPKRWYDEEGTEALESYFDGIVYTYGLQNAIDQGALCPYYYIPHIVELTLKETEEYLSLTNKIGRLAQYVDDDIGDADLQDNTNLKHALFRRARIVGTAENKLERLTELIDQSEGVQHTLVYCGDGSVEADDIEEETKRHVDATAERLCSIGVNARRFTARESQSERELLLQDFEDGDLQALVAIRCLDEGVDIPATETAYMLASSTNPRQFVQRRGRILRTHPGKKNAVIHDFIAIPGGGGLSSLDSEAFSAERSLIEKELQRVSTFAEAAINHPDAEVPGIPSDEKSLRELKRIYNLRDM
jgi:DNA phosphorothioation system restriction enzyme